MRGATSSGECEVGIPVPLVLWRKHTDVDCKVCDLYKQQSEPSGKRAKCASRGRPKVKDNRLQFDVSLSNIFDHLFMRKTFLLTIATLLIKLIGRHFHVAFAKIYLHVTPSMLDAIISVLAACPIFSQAEKPTLLSVQFVSCPLSIKR